MTFEDALTALKDGKRVSRQGWNGKGMWIAIQFPDEHSKMKRPYIYMLPADGYFVPWIASQMDFLATDWDVVA